MKRAMPRLRSVALLLFAVFLFVLLLINADIAMDGVRQGLSLCTETLIPSLFPFLVLSELLVASGVGETLGRLLSRPVSALFGLSGSGAVSLLLGSVCGFPVGTTTALALYQKGEMDKKELQRVVLFANNPSSGFLIGAVGEALFGNRGAGVALFVITLLSAATVGVVLHITQGTVASSNNIPPNGMQKRLSPADFTGSVKRGFSALLSVCAFVLFFACVSECLTPLTERLALPAPFCVLLRGALEMTTGISSAVTTLSPAVAFRMTALFASLSGLSVTLQVFSVAEEAHLSLLPYCLAHLLQGAVSLLFTELFLRLFQPDFITAESVDAAKGTFVSPSPFLWLPFVTFLLIVIVHCHLKMRQTQHV